MWRDAYFLWCQIPMPLRVIWCIMAVFSIGTTALIIAVLIKLLQAL